MLQDSLKENVLQQTPASGASAWCWKRSQNSSRTIWKSGTNLIHPRIQFSTCKKRREGRKPSRCFSKSDEHAGFDFYADPKPLSGRVWRGPKPFPHPINSGGMYGGIGFSERPNLPLRESVERAAALSTSDQFRRRARRNWLSHQGRLARRLGKHSRPVPARNARRRFREPATAKCKGKMRSRRKDAKQISFARVDKVDTHYGIIVAISASLRPGAAPCSAQRHDPATSQPGRPLRGGLQFMSPVAFFSISSVRVVQDPGSPPSFSSASRTIVEA